MADALQVELVAADRVVWSGQASQVIARTVDGDLGVLVGHAPLLSLLDAGVVEIVTPDDRIVRAAVAGGFLSIADNRVSILSEDTHLAEEIDAAAVHAELAKAEDEGEPEAVRRAQAKLRAVQKVS